MRHVSLISTRSGHFVDIIQFVYARNCLLLLHVRLFSHRGTGLDPHIVARATKLQHERIPSKLCSFDLDYA